MVIFAKSGAGKSYTVKLEVLRSLMMGTDVIVIDPENEYQYLTETVGGSYIKISLIRPIILIPLICPCPAKTTGRLTSCAQTLLIWSGFCALCWAA